ncbi:MAG: response regulator transcription factor [Propionibacteriaceae bacterium]|jgi:DNA-binding NarL/FixJ family response regulator|nr:response regulator transcription factor [Propionibacteriaceae bacterium]
MRLVLAEDSALLREGLVRLLEEAGHEVLAAVGDADALAEAVSALRPDLVVTDVRMPPTSTDDGLRAAVRLRQDDPSLAVLVLSQYVEQVYARDLLLPPERGQTSGGPAGGVGGTGASGRLSGTGASDRIGGTGASGGVGYLLKDRIQDFSGFDAALRRVAEGQTVIDPEVIRQLLVARYAHSPLDRLSDRERQVLALIAEGLSNAAIGERLTITDGAVEKHISSIFSKLDLPPDATAHRRVQAVLAWLQG